MNNINIKLTVFGFVLTQTGTNGCPVFLKRHGVLGFTRTNLLAEAKVWKRSPDKLAARFAFRTRVLPIFADPRRVGDKALQPPKLWYVEQTSGSATTFLAHTVRQYNDFSDGDRTVYVDGARVRFTYPVRWIEAL